MQTREFTRPWGLIMQVHGLDKSKQSRNPVTDLLGTRFGRLIGRLAGFIRPGRTGAPRGGPNAAGPSSCPAPKKGRLARLQRECDVGTAPAMLLATACTVLVLVLSLNALLDEVAPALVANSPPQLNAATQLQAVK
jgi:hypothetical protein